MDTPATHDSPATSAKMDYVASITTIYYTTYPNLRRDLTESKKHIGFSGSARTLNRQHPLLMRRLNELLPHRPHRWHLLRPQSVVT